MLSVVTSCDISEFLPELVEKSGKKYGKVESLLFDEGIYPEGSASMVDRECTKVKWLQEAINKILDKLKIDELQIVEDY